jgi:hypothetical protein
MVMISPLLRRTSVLRSKTLAQAEFTSAEHFKSRGPTKCLILWADQQQLDDLCIACTKVEEETAE